MRDAGLGRLRLPLGDWSEIEGLIAKLKQDLGLQVEVIPRSRDSWRLAALFADRLEIRFRERNRAMAMLHPDECATIWLPEGWEEVPLERALLEELGHFLLTVRAFDALPEDRKAQQLYKLWERRDESRVGAFVLCWLIPEAKLWEYMGREAELAELCRCTEQDVWDRLGLYR